MSTCKTSAQFIDYALTVREENSTDLMNDIRYLWWALSEIRTCTQEPLEVLDCSPLGDGLFASLMACRMKPCEAHYLFKVRNRERAKTLSALCGVRDYVVPVLDGKVPLCNVYDAIIIDPMPHGRHAAGGALRDVLANCAWRFTRIFVRNGNDQGPLATVYQSMTQTMQWVVIPHTTIVAGHMSEEWCHSITPPS